jgi:hypothetical protein
LTLLVITAASTLLAAQDTERLGEERAGGVPARCGVVSSSQPRRHD